MQVLAPRLCRLAAVLLLALCFSGCGRKGIEPVFDVPSLLGRDIEGATRALGKPTREETSESGAPRRVWVKDGVSLAAEWKPSSGRVLRWTLLVREPKNALRDEDKAQLLKAARAGESDARYSVEYVEAPERPTFSVGAYIIPAPRQHEVTFRVTGTEALLEVVTQPARTPQGETFVTLPPWQSAFQASDDTRLSLYSRIVRNQVEGSPFSMRVEIIVDGKVVKEATSTGAPVSVEYEL
jgi:hypothetical protein